MLRELGFKKTSERSREEKLKRLGSIATVGAASAISRTLIPGP